MRDKYSSILSALSTCPSAFNESEEFYKARFEGFVKEYDKSFIYRLKSDIRLALKDADWSWKKAAEKVDFYAYDENSTESEILKDIRCIMWDCLFVHNDEELETVQKCLSK